MRLSAHQKTDTSYIKKANLILELAKNAATTFKNANFDHKRRFAQKLFSNCFLKDRELDLELRMPYDRILESSRTGNWRPLLDTFRNHDIQFGFSLQYIQTVCSTFGIYV